MKTVRYLLFGVLLIVGSCLRAQDANYVNMFFVQKALKNQDVRSLITVDSSGQLKPVCFFCPIKDGHISDPSKVMIHVEHLEFNGDGNGESEVVLVFHIDNKYEVTSTFVSDSSMRNWTEYDTTIRYSSKRKI